jgi:phage terminase large subunit
MEDATGIWWFQLSFGQRRMLAYQYGSGQSLAAYVALLEEFKGRHKDLVYGTHYLPHDVTVRDLGTGFTREKTLRDLGLRNMRIVPKHAVQDRIQAVRSALATTFFDEEPCEDGLEGLRQYSRTPLEGQFDPSGNQMFGKDPHHDWTSHPADAFGTGVMGARAPRYGSDPNHKSLASDMAIC